MSLDERDLSIIAQSANKAASDIYCHSAAPDTYGFDVELFDDIRNALFNGVIGLVGQHFVQAHFPGTTEAPAAPAPQFRGPQQAGPPQPQYQQPAPPPQQYQQAPPQYAPPPVPQGPPAGGAPQNPPCHRCGAPMKQQLNKRNPKAPDFKCSNGGWDSNSKQEWGCQGAAWLNNGQLKGN